MNPTHPPTQYSLAAFSFIFNKALDKAASASDVETRVDNLQSSITHTLFDFVTRGLFERHRIIFRTQLAIKVLQAQTDERGERLISSRSANRQSAGTRHHQPTRQLAPRRLMGSRTRAR